jgi:aminopeptidase N
VATHSGGTVRRENIISTTPSTPIADLQPTPGTSIIFNSNGFGYGQFPGSLDNLHIWNQLSEVEKGTELINLYEQLLAAPGPDMRRHFAALEKIIGSEKNQLLLNLALQQLHRMYWSFITPEKRLERAPELEDLLWQTMLAESISSRKKIYFDAFADIALSRAGIQRIYKLWSKDLIIDQLILSEDDDIALSQILAIKLPEVANEVVAAQIERTENPDSQRKLRFLTASLSPDQAERDRFFLSLASQENRQIESWVVDALENLHHPLRLDVSEQYILPALELLQEIQITGDIFFPKNWLDTTLKNYNSLSAVHTVSAFLQERPDYNEQLRMKILQSADMMTRATKIVGAGRQ